MLIIDISVLYLKLLSFKSLTHEKTYLFEISYSKKTFKWTCKYFYLGIERNSEKKKKNKSYMMNF